MDPSQLDPIQLERLRRQSAIVEERRVRAVQLRRLLDHVGVTIDDVVNSRRAKAEVLRWYRIADACTWEERRSYLRRRAAHQQWLRENL